MYYFLPKWPQCNVATRQAACWSHYSYFVLEASPSEHAAQAWIFRLLLVLYTETWEVIFSLWKIHTWSRSIEGRLRESWSATKLQMTTQNNSLNVLNIQEMYHHKLMINKYIWGWIYTQNACATIMQAARGLAEAACVTVPMVHFT